MSGLLSNKGVRPYLYALIALWVIGCLLQYLFCCGADDTKVSSPVAATTAVTADNEVKPLNDTANTTDEVATDHVVTDKVDEATNTDSLAETVTLPTFELLDNDNVVLSADGNLTFPERLAELNPVPDDVEKALSQLREQIPNDKALSITGYYLASETAPNGFENMGLARADAVKTWLTTQSYSPDHVITVAKQQTSLVGRDQQHLIATQFNVVDAPVTTETTATPQVSQATASAATPTEPTSETTTLAAPPTPTASNNPFHVAGEGIDISGEDNFNFISGDYSPLLPIAAALDGNITQVIDHLNADENRQLTIKGRYHPDEHNGSAFPDLGLARANQVKDYFILSGAKSQQITLASSPYPEAVPNSQKHYAGMIDYELTALDGEALQARSLTMQQLADDIRINPLTLYFDTGVSEIALDNAQRQHLLKIAQYLDFDQNAKAIVTGHTDNVGNRETNTQLGKERAEFAADYLSKNGLRRAQMTVDSKGPDQPIADNNSEEGRAKNRRVTITISENNQ